MITYHFYLLTAFAMLFAFSAKSTVAKTPGGAMLPGAIFGLISVMGMGNPPECAVMAAAGAAASYMGAGLAVDESVKLASAPQAPGDYKRGMIGLALKGGLWLGFIAIIVGMTSQRFYFVRHNDIPIIICALPVLNVIGKAIFNAPCEPASEIYPKIYFAKSKAENWGGLLLMNLFLFIYALSHKAYGSADAWAAAIIGGAIGLPAAYYIEKKLSVVLARRAGGMRIRPEGLLFGVIGGLCYGGIMLVYRYPRQEPGPFAAAGLSWLWLIVAAVWEIVSYVAARKNPAPPDVARLRAAGVWDEETAADKKPDSTVTPGMVWFVYRYGATVGNILYCYVPIMFVLSGNNTAAHFISGSLILYFAWRAAAQLLRRACSNDKAQQQSLQLYRIVVYAGGFAVLLSAVLSLTAGFAYWGMWLLYTAIYLVYLLLFRADKRENAGGRVFNTLPIHLVAMAITLILGLMWS